MGIKADQRKCILAAEGTFLKSIFKVLTCPFMASPLAFLRGTLSTSRQVDENIKETENY